MKRWKLLGLGDISELFFYFHYQSWNSHAEGWRDDVFNQQVEGQSGQVILLTDTEDAT